MRFLLLRQGSELSADAHRLMTFCITCLCSVIVAAAAAAPPMVTPPPRHVKWTGERIDAARLRGIRADSVAARQIGRILSAELLRLHGRKLPVLDGAAGNVRLILENDRGAADVISTLPGASLYRQHAGPESYLLDAQKNGVTIVAATPRGLLYGVQTLLQMFRGVELAGASIIDYPQLAFRGLHICLFPNTELAAVRQAILMAARYKYNAVVIEPWASLRSPKHPETAYEDTYTAEQLKPLVQLGKALQMDMIPMLNSWGHASGMRSRSSQHVVLDRFPEFKPLYEEDGWSFCLTNSDIYKHLFERYDELLELFDRPRYFHLGLDEAWGHIGLQDSPKCRGDNPRVLLSAHIKKLYDYFAARNIQVLVWHDMFIQRNHPQFGRLSPANSVPPYDTHLVLDELPKDIVMDAWNYDQTSEWPVPKILKDRGFPVVVSPWKSRKNAVSLLNTAKKLNAFGLLETTWDSLDVSLPTVGEAGVLAWTEPGFNLDTIPFGNFLHAIRLLPIGNLPQLERTSR